MKLLGIALLTAVAFQQALAPQRGGMPPTDAIRGVLLRAGARSPISAAHVVLMAVSGSKPQGQRAIVTDNEGKFAFSTLDPGEYTLQFAAAGYLTASFSKPIRVASDETVFNIVMELTPTAVVTGAVRDVTGKSVSRVPVHLIRSQYSSGGQKTFEIVMQTYTNDLGDYRIFSITPGRYYVSAGGSPSDRPRDNEINFNDIELTYRRLFFPNTYDARSAMALEMGPGELMSGIDLTLPRMERYRIRGRVIDAASRLPETAGVGRGGGALPPDPSAAPTAGRGARGLGSRSTPPRIEVFANAVAPVARDGGSPWETTTADGDFEISNVPPGEYRLSADGGRAVMVMVSDSDVDGVALTLRPNPSLSGKIETDNGAVPPAVRIQLRNSDTRATYGASQKPDGTFTVTAPSGNYHAELTPAEAGLYIREMWLGEMPVSQLPLVETNTAPLRVALGSAVGRLSGTVRSEESELPANATVVIVPELQRHRADLYRNAVADQDGRFEFNNVPPGDYRVFAWRTIERYSWMDPAVLSTFEEQGKSIHVGERSQETIDLRVISPEGRP